MTKNDEKEARKIVGKIFEAHNSFGIIDYILENKIVIDIGSSEITFSLLEELVKAFHTRNLNFSGHEGYYGGPEACIVIKDWSLEKSDEPKE